MSYQETAPAERPRTIWKDLATITSPKTDLAIRVQTNESGRPQYSYEVGKMREGKFLRFIRMDMITEMGKVSVVPLDLDAFAQLWADASAAAVVDGQRREDEFSARRNGNTREVTRPGFQAEPPRKDFGNDKPRKNGHGGGERPRRDEDHDDRRWR